MSGATRRPSLCYATAELDLDALVARSSGATQAFLKDCVHRAVQIATERLTSDAGKVELRTADVDTALREARSSAQGASGRIIGFPGE